MTLWDYVEHLRDYVTDIPHIRLWDCDEGTRIWEGEYDEIPEEYEEREVGGVDIYVDENYIYPRVIIEINLM